MPKFALARLQGSQPSRQARAGAVLAGLCLGLVTTMAPAVAAPRVRATSPTKLAQAVAIASESRSQVVTLHDLAVSVGRANGIPAKVIDSSAGQLVGTFASEARTCRALDEPASSPTGALAASLASYSNFAGQVASATKRKGPSMGPGFVKALAANDKRWEGALAGLGKAAHVNLLSEVPKLLYPIANPSGTGGGK